jgi:hypothetical protein
VTDVKTVQASKRLILGFEFLGWRQVAGDLFASNKHA